MAQTAAPVTVVVATRNRADRLDACLDTVASLPERPAIIVVDNGSTDGTPRMIQSRYPRVTLIRLESNHGAVARNVGVRAADTDVVAFADDDSGWSPGSLARAEALMRRWPRLALIAARILVGSRHTVDPVSRFMATAPLGTEPDLPGPSVLGFLACGSIVRRDAFLQAGGFDPVVFFMGEEARLAYDLARLGWGLAYCDEVVATHHPATQQDPQRRSVADRNRALTSWMRRPLPLAVSHSAQLAGRALRDRSARRAAVGLARRLPSALAVRISPDPTVERALRRLERTERAWGSGR